MDKLAAFLSSMIALSVGVERIVEIIKGLSQKLRDDPHPDPGGKGSARRHLRLQATAALAGMIVALTIGPHNLFASIPEADYSKPIRWIASLLLGLMASGGSAFWNHALDIIGAVKSVKEQAASSPMAETGPRPTLRTGS
jgi:hypothetical protein